MAFYQEMGSTFKKSRVAALQTLPEGVPLLFDDDFKPYAEINRFILQKVTGSWPSPHTWTAAVQAYKQFLSWLELSEHEWDEVRYRHLVSFRDHLVSLELKSSTVNSRLVFVQQFYRWASDVGLIAPISIKFSDLKYRSRIQAGVVKFIEKNKAVSFIRSFKYAFTDEFVREQNSLIASTMLSVGLRRSEIASLMINDVPDFDPNSDYQYGEVVGKGNKKRVVQWPTRLINAIEKFIIFHRRPFVDSFKGKNADSTDPGFLFVSTKTCRNFHQNSINKIFSRASEVCGIYCTPHMLRHSYATYWLKENDVTESNVVWLRNLLGHSHSDTTLVYVHAVKQLAIQSEGDDFALDVLRKVGLK